MRYYCVMQHDERDCGAACLATISYDYGMKRPLSFYRNMVKTDLAGSNIYGIVNAAIKVGFKAIAYEVSFEELYSNEVHFPIVARIINEQNLYHFVVINRVLKNKLYISDPGIGKTKMSINEFKSRFTGHIIVFEKTESFQKMSVKSDTYYFFAELVKKNKKLLIWTCILSFIISALGMLFAFGIRYEFETLETEEQLKVEYGELNEYKLDQLYDLHEAGTLSEVEYLTQYILMENVLWLKTHFYMLVILLVLVAVFKVLFEYIQDRITVRLSLEFSKRTLKELTNTILELSQTQIERWRSGDLIKRYADANTTASSIIQTIVTIAVDLVMTIYGGIILYQQSCLLFCIVCIMVFVYVVITFIFVRPIRNSNIRELEEETNQDSLIKEIVDSLFDINVFNAKEYALECADRQIDNALNQYQKARKIEIGHSSCISFVSIIFNILLMIGAFYLIIDGYFTIGSYIAFLSLMELFISPIEALVGLQGTIQNGLISYRRLSDVLDTFPEIVCNGEENEFVLEDYIQFKDVTFRYGNKMPIFVGLNIEIPVGKHTLINGGNGAGKSTIAKLIMGLYMPESGDITFDGVCLSNIRTSQLRNNIVYVPQETSILTKSIKENIIYGSDIASEKEIEKVCNIVGLDTYIKTLPQKYNTLLEERGKNISSGQKQRLAIARALLRKPQVIILDEAVSNIDREGITKIYHGIKEEYPHMTIISILHSIDSDIFVDNIIEI